MSWLTKILPSFGKKSLEVKEISDVTSRQTDSAVSRFNFQLAWMLSNGGLNPKYIADSEVGVLRYLEYSEVFFPIHFIASRIAGAHFEIRRTSDDSIVWCANRSSQAKEISRLLEKPNWLQSWQEFVYMHFVMKLADGNGYIRAAMNSDVYSADTPKWKYCTQLWSIPSNMVVPRLSSETSGVRLFGCETIDDVIKHYTIGGSSLVPAWQIFHDRDLFPSLGTMTADNYLKSPSRLLTVKRNISTLGLVYDARNTIYSKCGALGIITNRQKDEAGHVAMREADKRELERRYSDAHGVTDGKSPIAITDADVDFLKIGNSIAELQPFDETLYDAIAIAGAYDIPSVLVPRKDQSTFANQSAAEKYVYSKIIPMAEQFCADLTNFLGFTDYYIHCNFDFVDCLQAGRKEAEQTNQIVNDVARQQFNDGLITYNDWRARIHESAMEGDIYDKTKFEMTDEERSFVASIISGSTAPTPTTNTNTTDNGEDNESTSDNESE